MSSESSPSPPPPVNENEFDVCLGRGNGVASRMGNRHYRKTIKENQQKYQETRGNRAKEQVAQDIIDAFQGRGGTFYYKTKKGWEKAPTWRVLKTVKQALRERKRDPCDMHLPPSKQKKESKKESLASKGQSVPGLITMNGRTLKAIVWNLSDKNDTSSNSKSRSSSFNSSLTSSLSSSLTSSLTSSITSSLSSSLTTSFTSSMSTFNDSDASGWLSNSGSGQHHRRISSNFITNQLSPFGSDDEGEGEDGQSVSASVSTGPCGSSVISVPS